MRFRRAVWGSDAGVMSVEGGVLAEGFWEEVLVVWLFVFVLVPLVKVEGEMAAL